MSHCARILLLDPDSAVTARITEDAANQSPGEARSIIVVEANDLATATRLLSQDSFDAAVVDLSLSDDDATSFVGEVERQFPGLVVVATTEHADEPAVARSCHLGAAGILVKPYGLPQLAALLRAPSADAGFSGTCAGVPTALLLTLHCQNGADGVLHLSCEATGSRPERRGSVHVAGGQPVHASTGSLTGAEAVHAMLAWPDAEATWLPGSTHSARTIVGRWEGLLVRGMPGEPSSELEDAVSMAYPEVIEKLSRLSQTQDVLGAFLLRHAEVITGRCTSGIDQDLAGRSLQRLAHVFHDVEAQPGEVPGREIQAIVGGMRLVLDRVGPVATGFQVGVLVRQAAPVCKSLRRLLRQVDRAFARAHKAHERKRSVRPTAGPGFAPDVAAVA
ncbi:MAG: response regulator [Nannocystaceae bacterium]|nr:response regulator [Nannocystaceae bacterium]